MPRFFICACFFSAALLAATVDHAVIGSDNTYNARALAMGGAATALAYDYSAVYWNPAALALIKRKEMHVSMGYYSHAYSYSSAAAEGEASISRFKLQSMGYVHPFPTSRGSLAIALGYSRPKNFLNAYHWTYNNSGYGRSGNSEGHLSRWDLAAAVDLSRKISFGGGLGLVTGREDFTEQTHRAVPMDTLTSFKDGYVGVSGMLGVLARLAGPLALGANVELLNYVSTDRSTTDETDSSFLEYDPFNSRIGMPVRFALGLAYATTPFSAGLDMEMTFWEALEFMEEGVPRYATGLQNTRRVGVGAEWLVPGVPAKLRAGVGYQTEPFTNAVPDGLPLFFSAGAGLLFDRVLALDVAGRYHEREYGGLKTVSRSQILITASYRL